MSDSEIHHVYSLDELCELASPAPHQGLRVRVMELASLRHAEEAKDIVDKMRKEAEWQIINYDQLDLAANHHDRLRLRRRYLQVALERISRLDNPVPVEQARDLLASRLRAAGARAKLHLAGAPAPSSADSDGDGSSSTTAHVSADFLAATTTGARVRRAPNGSGATSRVGTAPATERPSHAQARGRRHSRADAATGPPSLRDATAIATAAQGLLEIAYRAEALNNIAVSALANLDDALSARVVLQDLTRGLNERAARR